MERDSAVLLARIEGEDAGQPTHPLFQANEDRHSVFHMQPFRGYNLSGNICKHGGRSHTSSLVEFCCERM